MNGCRSSARQRSNHSETRRSRGCGIGTRELSISTKSPTKSKEAANRAETQTLLFLACRPRPLLTTETALTTAARQSLQELPCLSQPTRRPVHSGDPLPLASYDTAQRPSHRGSEPNTGQPAHLQQDPWAPASSQQQQQQPPPPPPPQSEKQPVFPSCHCSFSEQEASLSQTQHHPVDPLPPQPSPPFQPPIPPPPTSSSSSLLFSGNPKRGEAAMKDH
ncbi:small conductance calcium-activated potassium channel protein 1a isoform X1 [Lates japonicus]|uniref:Small conductance calcium-activated potassium channel protein 1a isoform X1 n=1 Tax=Lates japonicus TaxID=270547 RepID=A0AAD3NGM0_LATJO|nr:small conductance calcium-activated potassium channel protein 1a isoform X1 [Lates japonicus]